MLKEAHNSYFYPHMYEFKSNIKTFFKRNPMSGKLWTVKKVFDIHQITTEINQKPIKILIFKFINA